MGDSPQYVTDALARVEGAILRLLPHGATPPVNTYVTQSQFLRIKTYSALAGITLNVYIQMLLPDGRISQNLWPITPTSTRSAFNFTFPLTEGFILEVAIASPGTPAVNRVFAQVSLLSSQGGPPLNTQVLCEGYLNAGGVLTFPNGELQPMGEGAGAVISITGTTPGAGAEISETVPVGALWVLKTFTFSLVSSAAVANRIPTLTIDDGSNVLLQSPAPTAQAGSLANRYVTGDGAFPSVVNNNVQWLQLVNGLRLMPGWRIRTSTANLQAADQYTAPQYSVQEWLFS